MSADSTPASPRGGPGTAANAPRGALAPFRVPVFHAVWTASLVSNLGSWMHLVAASWLMTSLTVSAALVALLQTANALPSFALSLPAGAMADVFDRRRIILVTQTYQLAVAAALGAVTIAGGASPVLLLGLTFALAVGATVGMPAFSAITPELVPAEELPAAISLNSTTTTLSQAVGPAIGGVLVASLGAGAVFLVNAVSFLAVLIAVAAWRRRSPVSALPPEHVTSAVRTGLRYTVNAPELVTVLVRAGAYVIGYSALPALLAVLARTRLGVGAGGYGLLLGLLGAGGVAGAVLLPRLRARLSTDVLVGAATIGYAVVLVAVGLVPRVAVVAVLMVLAGFCGMAVMSSLNIAAQLVLPGWVRGRGLAVFMLVFQLGFAASAAVWGFVATRAGLPAALVAAGVVLAASATLGLRLRLSVADGVDVRPAYQPEPHASVEVDPDDGPVLITTEYQIETDDEELFRAVLHALRRSRRRDGALQWALYEDVERPRTHLETYVVRSWTEHQRQGERRTGADQRALDDAAVLHHGAGRPAQRYLLGHDLHRATHPASTGPRERDTRHPLRSSAAADGTGDAPTRTDPPPTDPAHADPPLVLWPSTPSPSTGPAAPESPSTGPAVPDPTHGGQR